MTDTSGGPGKGQVGTPGLAAYLCDLMPETRTHMAWAVAEAFRSVPWTPGALPQAEPDLASFGLTEMDAEIGNNAVMWCCSNYQLVYALHDLLTESQKAPPQARAALRRNCGRLIADGLADDVGWLREPLELLLDEELEIEILDDLIANTELGERFRLVTATDAHGINYQVPETSLRDPGSRRSSRPAEPAAAHGPMGSSCLLPGKSPGDCPLLGAAVRGRHPGCVTHP